MQAIYGDRLRFRCEGKIARGNKPRLIQPLRETNAYRGTAIFVESRGCQPYVMGKHFGVEGAAFQVIDWGKRIDLIRVLEDSHCGKWLGLAAHAKARRHERRPGAAKRFRGGPLHKGVGEDDRAIAAEKHGSHELPNQGIDGKFRRTPGRNVDFAQSVVDGIGIRQVLTHRVHLAREVLPVEIEVPITQLYETGSGNGGLLRPERLHQAVTGIDDPDIRMRGCGPALRRVQQTPVAREQPLKCAPRRVRCAGIELEYSAQVLPSRPAALRLNRKGFGKIKQYEPMSGLGGNVHCW